MCGSERRLDGEFLRLGPFAGANRRQVGERFGRCRAGRETRHPGLHQRGVRHRDGTPVEGRRLLLRDGGRRIGQDERDALGVLAHEDAIGRARNSGRRRGRLDTAHFRVHPKRDRTDVDHFTHANFHAPANQRSASRRSVDRSQVLQIKAVVLVHDPRVLPTDRGIFHLNVGAVIAANGELAGGNRRGLPGI